MNNQQVIDTIDDFVDEKNITKIILEYKYLFEECSLYSSLKEEDIHIRFLDNNNKVGKIIPNKRITPQKHYEVLEEEIGEDELLF